MKLLVLAFLVLFGAIAEARDPAQVREFRRHNPCPSTGQTVGACPGWVVDHVIPLALYGRDDPSNMQWQTKETALAKDKLEWGAIRRMKKACQKL